MPLWAALCRRVPARYAARCDAIRRAGACWPDVNPRTDGSRVGGVIVGHDDAARGCRPWPRGVCTFVPSPLRANRSRGGSVTGGWTELKDSALRIGHLDRKVIECGRYEYF